MATLTVLLLTGLPSLQSLVEKGAKEREREELEVWIMNKSNLIYIYLYIVFWFANAAYAEFNGSSKYNNNHRMHVFRNVFNEIAL